MKKLAVRRITKKNIIDNNIEIGIAITMITHVLDNDAIFCYAAYAPNAAYISYYIFDSVGMQITPLTNLLNKKLPGEESYI